MSEGRASKFSVKQRSSTGGRASTANGDTFGAMRSRGILAVLALSLLAQLACAGPVGLRPWRIFRRKNGAKELRALTATAAAGWGAKLVARRILRRMRLLRVPRKPLSDDGRADTWAAVMLGASLIAHQGYPDPPAFNRRGQVKDKRLTLVDTEEALKDKLIALYINSGEAEEVLAQKGGEPFTPRLKKLYEACRAEGKALEVVYVGLEPTDREFRRVFARMPWLSTHRAQLRQLATGLGIRSLPAVVLLRPDGTVVNADGYSAMSQNMHPSGYPWAAPKLPELLAGPTVAADGSAGVLPRSGVIGVYHSASWCGPCRQFTPMLRQLREQLRARGVAFEVLFVSADQDEGAFDAYRAAMPWPTVPFGDAARRDALRRNMDVKGYPTLTLVDAATGAVICADARKKLLADRAGERFPWRRELVEDAKDAADDIFEAPAVLLFAEALEHPDASAAADALRAAAREREAAAPGNACRYYLVRDAEVGRALRRLCGLGVPSAQHRYMHGAHAQDVLRPCLALLDFPAQRVTRGAPGQGAAEFFDALDAGALQSAYISLEPQAEPAPAPQAESQAL